MIRDHETLQLPQDSVRCHCDLRRFRIDEGSSPIRRRVIARGMAGKARA